MKKWPEYVRDIRQHCFRVVWSLSYISISVKSMWYSDFKYGMMLRGKIVQDLSGLGVEQINYLPAFL